MPGKYDSLLEVSKSLRGVFVSGAWQELILHC
jgi:hypothetical protein